MSRALLYFKSIYLYYIHYRFNHGTYLHVYSSGKVEQLFIKKKKNMSNLGIGTCLLEPSVATRLAGSCDHHNHLLRIILSNIWLRPSALASVLFNRTIAMHIISSVSRRLNMRCIMFKIVAILIITLFAWLYVKVDF